MSVLFTYCAGHDHFAASMGTNLTFPSLRANVLGYRCLISEDYITTLQNKALCDSFVPVPCS